MERYSTKNMQNWEHLIILTLRFEHCLKYQPILHVRVSVDTTLINWCDIVLKMITNLLVIWSYWLKKSIGQSVVDL